MKPVAVAKAATHCDATRWKVTQPLRALATLLHDEMAASAGAAWREQRQAGSAIKPSTHGHVTAELGRDAICVSWTGQLSCDAPSSFIT